MRIRMLSLAAGPGGIRRAGQVYDVDPVTAADLAAAGAAELLEPLPVEDPETLSPADPAEWEGAEELLAEVNATIEDLTEYASTFTTASASADPPPTPNEPAPEPAPAARPGRKHSRGKRA